ncbi:MAG: penicillin-binding protein activator LpoB [Gammaproteobacteria bacterium]|nr:penicillin-binding protein activator LpoB [Gammaproteobacteria bacterium]MDH5651141.1 penicillin-binding protein activator LpoB [Gammaproteobacteria bacterium]
MHALKKNIFIMALIAGLATLGGCGGIKVKRTDAGETIDLSGAWNDTDSQQVSKEMIDDMLEQRWLRVFKQKNRGKAPTVIVGDIRNLSHEHINTRTFIADIERAVINSGEVEFVASKGERGEIREERVDQDLHSRADTRKAMGQEIGADFMLQGRINTIIDAVKREQVRYYQVDLTLISLKDNRKVWVGQKKIKKHIEGSGLRF